jgi:hypothetical protein
MNASEVVQPGIVANNSETLRRSTAQVGRTVKSTSLTLAGRMFRNVNDWRVEEAVYGRRSFQAAAIAADVSNHPPAEPGAFENVSRSKRLSGVANAAPNLSGHQ